VYRLRQGEAIYLKVKLLGLDSVHGYVRDHVTERPLGGVRVSMHSIETHTDVHGWFVLHIPPKAQSKFINLMFEKEGYEGAFLEHVAPHTGVAQKVSLHPL
jgi:hypothetical protein